MSTGKHDKIIKELFSFSMRSLEPGVWLIAQYLSSQLAPGRAECRATAATRPQPCRAPLEVLLARRPTCAWVPPGAPWALALPGALAHSCLQA